MTITVTGRSEKPAGWITGDREKERLVIELKLQAFVVLVDTLVLDEFWDGPVAIGDTVYCERRDDRWHFWTGRKP